MKNLPDITDYNLFVYKRKKLQSEFDIEIKLIGKCKYCSNNITSIDKVYDGDFCSPECSDFYGLEGDES